MTRVMCCQKMLYHVMSLAHGLVLFGFSESCCNIGRKLPSIPYVRGNCTMDHAITMKMDTILIDCIELCERTSACIRIEHNSEANICMLKDSRTIKDWLQGKCIVIDIQPNDTFLTDACAVRPCSDTSVCITDLDAPGEHVCKITYCPNPKKVIHAELLSNVYTKVGHKNVYRCDKNYTGFGGSPYIECTGNGSWTATNFKCSPNCQVGEIYVENAYVGGLSALSYPTNYTLEYKCKDGFYNIAKTELVCDENGEWTQEVSSPCLPYCEHSQIPIPKFGDAYPGENYTIYQYAKVYCTSGYYMDPVKPNVTCNEDGTWTAAEGLCLKYCVAPTNPANGLITSTLTQYRNGAVVNYDCDTNYVLYPSGQGMTCTHGTWSIPPECRRTCQNPPGKITNQHIQYASLLETRSINPPYLAGISKARYICDAGRVDRGSEVLECGHDGNWHGQIVCCSADRDYYYRTNECISD